VIRDVGVIGAGTMGTGIAQAFAQAGYLVHLFDAAPDAYARARSAIERSLGKFVDKRVMASAERESTLARLHRAASLEALQRVDFVVEAISEDVDEKRALFTAIDTLVRPDVVLASNTSSIPIASLAAATRRPTQVAGMHFMNPVPLMPLVEVIRAVTTSQATLDTVMGLCHRMGKTPVEAADRPGFIANRVLMPMINEAVAALADGVGTVEAIDTVMKLGMSHPMGPLALADLIGLDVCVAIMDVMAKGLEHDKYAPHKLLREMVRQGKLGRKSAEGFYQYR